MTVGSGTLPSREEFESDLKITRADFMVKEIWFGGPATPTREHINILSMMIILVHTVVTKVLHGKFYRGKIEIFLTG